MKTEKKFSQFKTYEVARLIPTVKESKQEERATSVLLGVFRVVPRYAKEMLAEVGAPTSKRIKIQCLTEVVPVAQVGKLRPDGYISVSIGKRTWSALIESKVGNNQLESAQVENYASLARKLGCDALITISNQYATLPTHHPVSINKSKLGKLGLFHFSWLSLASKAQLMAQQNRISDPEQAFILDEFIRYLEHPYSGVSLMTQMGSGWRSVAERVLQGMKLLKTANKCEQAVASWQQLTRYLVLRLSVLVGEQVEVYLPRAHKSDPSARQKYQIEELCSNHTLTEQFEVPDAASRITLMADFARRSISLSMSLEAPSDRVRSTACITWLLRQLPDVVPDNMFIRANWPGRTPSTMAPVNVVKENPQVIVPDGVNALPKTLDVVQNCDLLANFKAKRKFVELTESTLTSFYDKIGQNLKRWVAPAPKLKEPDILEG